VIFFGFCARGPFRRVKFRQVSFDHNLSRQRSRFKNWPKNSPAGFRSVFLQDEESFRPPASAFLAVPDVFPPVSKFPFSALVLIFCFVRVLK
jgi:hypothetical protein